MTTIINDRTIDAANLMAAIADEFVYACLLLLLGETQRYEEFCRELLARPGEPQDAYAATVVARICAIGTSSAVDAEQLVSWATEGVRRLTDAATLHLLGLAQYRAGHYTAAIRTFQHSNASSGWSSRAKSQNWLVLAMARYRLGEMDEAEHCLEMGRQLIATARHKADDDEHDLAAGDWIELNVLLREAQTLLAEGIHSSELPR